MEARTYHGKHAALTTKHEKERLLTPPLRAAVGLHVTLAQGVDTDQLGTFSGEVERVGTPRETALRKARLGMTALGLPLGVASEGSFGPHPHVPFVPVNHELLLFVDDERGFQVAEWISTTETNFSQTTAASADELSAFLANARFPSHALIVRPNSGDRHAFLFKGLVTPEALAMAVRQAAAASVDGRASIETDMRAHLNPTRRQVIREVAARLARRLAACCPACGTAGWGAVDVKLGLPCEWCDSETELILAEVLGCPLCEHRVDRPRKDGKKQAPAMHCPVCNP